MVLELFVNDSTNIFLIKIKKNQQVRTTFGHEILDISKNGSH